MVIDTDDGQPKYVFSYRPPKEPGHAVVEKFELPKRVGLVFEIFDHYRNRVEEDIGTPSEDADL